MYKYVIITHKGTIGIGDTIKIFYAGDKHSVESKFAQDIYNATLFTTAAEATLLMDYLARKFPKASFAIDMVEITLTLM